MEEGFVKHVVVTMQLDFLHVRLNEIHDMQVEFLFFHFIDHFLLDGLREHPFILIVHRTELIMLLQELRIEFESHVDGDIHFKGLQHFALDQTSIRSRGRFLFNGFFQPERVAFRDSTWRFPMQVIPVQLIVEHENGNVRDRAEIREILNRSRIPNDEELLEDDLKQHDDDVHERRDEVSQEIIHRDIISIGNRNKRHFLAKVIPF